MDDGGLFSDSFFMAAEGVPSDDPGRDVYYSDSWSITTHWEWVTAQPVKFFRLELRRERERNALDRHAQIGRVIFKKNAREYVWYA